MRADPMDATWGNFQSFIQLAIALNSAFAAFGSYAGNDITRERARLTRIMGAVQNGASLPVTGHETVGGAAEIMLLEGKCADLLHNYNNFVTGFYRVICVIAAGIGIGFLLYSSILPNEKMNPVTIILVSIFYVPFYYGVWKAGKLSHDIYMSISLKADYIENHIRKQFPMGRAP